MCSCHHSSCCEATANIWLYNTTTEERGVWTNHSVQQIQSFWPLSVPGSGFRTLTALIPAVPSAWDALSHPLPFVPWLAPIHLLSLDLPLSHLRSSNLPREGVEKDLVNTGRYPCHSRLITQNKGLHQLDKPATKSGQRMRRKSQRRRWRS